MRKYKEDKIGKQKNGEEENTREDEQTAGR